MKHSRLAVVLLAGIVACQGDISQSPNDSPSYVISDATHSSGNPDFFWLPPFVKDPSKSNLFDVGKFNGELEPVVTVCELPGTAENQINAGTQCISGGYAVTLPASTVNLTNEFYQTSWTVPNSSRIFYRIKAYVGAILLGYADVESVPNPQQLKAVDKNNFVGQQDGSNLPVKYRIEDAALCNPPGVYPCASESVDLLVGNDIVTDTEDGTAPSGVHIPGQNNGQGGHKTVTVDDCEDMHTRGIVDIPTFGSCITITSDPALTSFLDNPATVFICDVGPDLPGTMLHDQQERVTLHQLDFDNQNNPTVRALPHAFGCPQITSQATFKGFFRALAQGKWKKAGRELAGVLSPRPLHARRLDIGGGGEKVEEFSDFQFGLPVALVAVEGDGQTAVVGTSFPLGPKVRAVDLGGLPVAGATVHFQGDGVTTAAVTTPGSGEASVPWTAAKFAGNVVTAGGIGLGGTDFSGPRATVDPFQPFPFAGDGESSPPAASGSVILKNGHLTFTSYGQESFENSEFSSWTATGFWHRSGVGAGIVNQAFTDQLVVLGSGDASNGGMPNPFHGTKVFWYGTEPGAGVGTENGNYIGTRSGNNGFHSGGESTAPNSGSLTSPAFVVPANGQLTLQTWFEIESVDPQAFDAMTVTLDPATGPDVPLGQLNPTTDPNGLTSQPFTSGGGFNAAPAWVPVTVDLSAYAGQTVQLRFSFNTGDHQYNGFRGWLLDNILVAPAPSSFRAAVTAGITLNPIQPAKSRDQ